MSKTIANGMRALFMREALAFLMLACVGMLALSLYSFDVTDPSLNQTNQQMPQNWLGWGGAYLSDMVYQLMGWTSWGLVVLALLWVWRIAWGHRPYTAGWISCFWLPFLLAWMGLLHLHLNEFSALPAGAGGALGVLMSNALSRSLSTLGADLVLFSLMLSSFVIASQISLLALLHRLFVVCVKLWHKGSQRVQQTSAKIVEENVIQKVDHSLPEDMERKEPEILSFNEPKRIEPEWLPAMDESLLIEEEACVSEVVQPSVEQPTIAAKEAAKPAVVSKVKILDRVVDAPQVASLHQAADVDQCVDQDMEEGFILPSLSLFHSNSDKKHAYTKEALEMMSRLLEEKLADYRVDGKVVAVQPGPVVVQFELELAAGTKSSKVVGLQNDLARSMSAFSVRVVGNIPGKNVIGIELPNEAREMVVLRDVLASQAFANRKIILPLALGVDIAGQPIVVDLAKMPHLLVAGTTGSGKSVAVNAMICSMLMMHTPQTLRLILVDPKMLELSMYDDIPHLLVPVVTSPHKANKALAWAVFEMERRYKMMSEAKVRNLAGYNKAASAQEDGEILPMIVIVIDELADLMMVAGKEVEQSICRLAQKARAAGLHLILATQRPSVDVITGLIKANLPSRLACKVSSKIDSRTILDQMGAEQLLGMGDSLFLDGGSDLKRVHGAFVSDAEVIDLVEHLKTQGAPDYKDEIFNMALDEVDEEDAMGGIQDEKDSKYDEAAALVIEKGKCSVSMVQRYLRIGYNRASRIVEQMERDGLVTPPGAGGSRKVLANVDGGVFE